MARSESPSKGLTRRNFLKTTGAGISLAGFGAAGMFTADTWLSPTEVHAEAEEHIAYTYHKTHCGGMCPLKCTVRDERLVLVEPNNCSEDRYETICLKGISEVQHVYSDHRIQTPLKRIGERGSNEFTSISWNEALDTICNTVKEISEKFGPGSVVMGQGDDGNNVPWLSGILGAPMDYDFGIDVGIGNGFDPATGYGMGYMGATNEARDWVNAKRVIMIGTNFLESSLPVARQFFEAQEAGTEFIVIDPHFSTTAGKADQWIPIEPGTDAALFLGMTTTFIEEGLYDENFVLQHSSFPFLLDVETGLLLRDHEEPEDAEEAETGETNPFMVWDGSAVVSFLTTEKPVLEGEFEFNGRKVTTVFSLLKEHQKQYSPEWAEDICGIEAETIRNLTRKYAEGPCCLAMGWGGNDKMGNADIAGHAAALIVALSGNIGKVGAGAGSYIEGNFNGHAAEMGVWEIPEELMEQYAEIPLHIDRDLKTCKALICNADTIHQHIGNMNKTADWAKELEFIVTIDPYFTEGAKWADVILPCATRFENEEEIGNVKQGYNNIVVQNKVLEPLFESHSDFWIQKELAKLFGVDEFLPKTSEEFAQSLLSNSPDSYIAALTIEDINAKQGIVPIQGIDEPRRDLMDLAFFTPSGRMEVYYEDMLSYGQGLPVWETPLEVYRENPLREKYPLQLANVRTRFRIHNQFNDAKWIQQVGEARLELCLDEMQARDLKDGDIVEVFNERGSFRVKVRPNESVRSNCARIFEGQSADFMVEGNVQNVTNDAYPERGLALISGPVIPFSDTLVEVKKA